MILKIDPNFTEDEKRYKAALNLLKRASSFQQQDDVYIKLLHDDSDIVRLEVLSFAVDDRIWLPENELRRVLTNGGVLERRYALLALSRNNHTEHKEVERIDLGKDSDAELWKLACHYAIEPSLSSLLHLFKFAGDDDAARASLVLNLCVTVANAVHRIVLYDLIKVVRSSGSTSARLNPQLDSALRHLEPRKSWEAVKNYRFSKSELWKLLG